MKARTVRHLIIGLLSVSAVFHLLIAMLGDAGEIAAPLAGMGLLYLVIGFFVRQDTNDGSRSHSRNAILAAIAACAADLFLGGGYFVQNGAPLALPIMAAVDIAIIAAGATWIHKMRGKKRH